jgi:transposase
MLAIHYVGMDVHKAITVIVVLNARGQIEGRSQVKTKAENICDFLRGLRGKIAVVFEEGTHSAWLYELIKPLVASVTVCDPRHNRLIGSRNKSDDEDAEQLARLLRLGEVKAVYKGDDQQQQLKELCRAYQNLVADSTCAAWSARTGRGTSSQSRSGPPRPSGCTLAETRKFDYVERPPVENYGGEISEPVASSYPM